MADNTPNRSTLKNQSIFVTGTDTGVGKTVVCAALLTLLRSKSVGLDAVPMKPVQTGCVRRHGQLVAPDLDFCLQMSGLAVSAAERHRMAPYCFAKACSPHLAAARAGRHIVLRRIMESFRELAREHDAVIVEGAGGLLVPLNEKETMLDLAKALALPVLLVARPGLGTLNHTLLSLRELERARLKVAGVVFNAAQRERWGEIEDNNIATVARRGRVRVLGCLPHMPRLHARTLHSLAVKHLPFASE